MDKTRLKKLTAKIVSSRRLTCEAEAARKTRESLEHIRKRVIDFQEADVNHDNELTFDEWVMMLPSATRTSHSVTELRKWFRMLDTDDGGTVSWDEYFLWAVRAHDDGRLR
jgi:Ca2+-binding EF-hand superfamily protein